VGGTLIFSIKDLEPIIEHSKSEKDFSKAYMQEKEEAGLFLVKDRGAYLMSNAKKPLYKWQVPIPDSAHVFKISGEASQRYRADMKNKEMWRNRIDQFAEAKLMTPMEYCLKYNLCNVNHSYVAYAEGCNAEKDEFYYDNSREICGGDDFAEFIPLDAVVNLIKRIKEANRKFFKIQMDEKSYKMFG
jgi:hypothetical protein